MSFFKKVFAQVLGVGGTKIDTRLEKSEFQPGEVIKGELFIKGGTVEQELDSVHLNVFTDYEVEKDDRTYFSNVKIQSHRVPINKKILVNEELTIPFSFVLGQNTPISLHKSHVWIFTNLDIEDAIDSGDKDGIQVVPSAGLRNVIEALQDLGFTLRECENKNSYGRIVQEFEFVPYSGVFRGKLDELEVNYIAEGSTVNVRLQVDRRARGLSGLFAESLGTDETLTRVTFTTDEVLNKQIVQNRLLETIRRFS
ncbi:MAG: sporulation protein SpoOM [Bacillales bacterium]|nr:sporulation protein SpoOM [Bacillales bacterium]